MNPHPHPSLLTSFRCAYRGLLDVIRTQRNFRIHLVIAALALLLAVWLRLPHQEWPCLIISIGTVLSAEVFNTSAEVLVDLASPENHPLAKREKDVAAGAVLLAAVFAVIVGLLLLGPPLWARLVLLF